MFSGALLSLLRVVVYQEVCFDLNLMADNQGFSPRSDSPRKDQDQSYASGVRSSPPDQVIVGLLVRSPLLEKFDRIDLAGICLFGLGTIPFAKWLGVPHANLGVSAHGYLIHRLPKSRHKHYAPKRKEINH